MSTVRNELIKLRATSEEKRELESRARASGQTLSDFVRRKVFDETGPRPESEQPSLDSFGTPAPGSEGTGIAAAPTEAEVKAYAYQNRLPTATARRVLTGRG